VTLAAKENQNPFAAIVLAYHSNRVGFVKHILGVEKLETWQEEELRALDTGCTRLSVKSGHGVGKTCWLAWIIIHFLMTRMPAKVAVTAPSATQLFDGLAAEVKMWIKTMEARHTFLTGVLNATSDHVYFAAAPERTFLTYRTSRKESPEALQGVHSEHVLLIGEEASGIHDPVFEAAGGSMSTKGAITVLAGNPTRGNGFFYQTHTNPALAKIWRRRTVSGFDSSRVTRDYIEEERAFGDQSNRWRIRVLGEFPEGDDDTLVQRAHVEAAVRRKIDHRGLNSAVYWGVDVARSLTGDKSSLAKRRGPLWLEPVKRWQCNNLMTLTGYIVNEYNKTPDREKPEAIFVDVIGLGAGVVDRLQELGLPAVGINVGEASSVMSTAVRLRDELWCHVRDWFAALNCSAPDDKETIDEICAITVTFTSAGKTKIESKDEMRTRMCGASPDGGDAFMLTFARDGAVAGGVWGGSKSRGKGPLKRKNTLRV
jgi:phage terminase large subunit